MKNLGDCDKKGLLIYAMSLDGGCAPSFCLYKVISGTLFFYLKLCVVNLMYMTFSYAVAFLVHSILVSVICILLYTIYQMSVYANNVAVFDYKDARLYFGFYAIHELVPFLVISFIFLVIGRGFNKYWMRYK